MESVVRVDTRGNVAVVLVHNPPVNALGPGVPEAIEDALMRALAQPEIEAIVLAGNGPTFIAGADIRNFEAIQTREESLEISRNAHDRLVRIEDLYKPVVAAIHGFALGGGLELAMACHYRVAASGARLGQPEVTLGMIPGAGGTQRLPRLCGAVTALEMCTGGSPISAHRALREGLIDRIIEGDLVDGAVGFAREVAQRVIVKTRERADKIDDADAGVRAVAAARAGLKKTHCAVTAAGVCVDAIEAGLTMSFEQGSQREIELFADCVLSMESRALVRLFFSEREAAKVPGVSPDTPTSAINRAAVIGAGMMGGGIAMALANAGIPVFLKETTREAMDRGMAAIRESYDSRVARGKMPKSQAEQVLSLIRPSLTFDGIEAADLVIEAVFENLELKRQVFSELGRCTRRSCLLASNTSTLDIDQMAEASGRAEQVIGLHFFSPANVLRLIEIVRGAHTSPQTIASALKLAKRLNKVGVVVANSFGFVANRLIAYYLREAGLLLEEGATVTQIDRVMTSFGLPVGPFGMQDLAGIDVGARIHEHLRGLGRQFACGPEPEVAGRLYAIGRYGQKTGAGFYRYNRGSRTPIPDPAVEEIAAAVAAKKGIERRVIGSGEILDRILLALINEGARVLEEGVAGRPGDIDVIYCQGFGFPRHRGGPMFYADCVGVCQILEKLCDFESRLGPHWHPAPLIERIAASGGSFYEPSPTNPVSAV